ncbi:MAG: hypothetical protein HKN67_06595 [Saprospiraceae bacterium]|nr:hypothetical protein [Saprospiraceae bacterium]
MKNHHYLFLVIVCVLSKPASVYAYLDTIPFNIKTHIDTVSIVDMETFEETVKVVEWYEYFVVSIDTTVIYDPSTKEEKITVVKNYNELSDYVNYLDENRSEINYDGVDLDTIVVFDSETYEETFNVIPRAHPCYYLGWGSRAFTTNSSLSQKEFLKNIRKPLNIWALNRDCEKTPDFSFSFIYHTKAGSSRIYNVSKANNTLPGELIPEKWIMPGARIIIHDIRIDGNDSMADIILKLK